MKQQQVSKSQKQFFLNSIAQKTGQKTNDIRQNSALALSKCPGVKSTGADMKFINDRDHNQGDICTLNEFK